MCSVGDGKNCTNIDECTTDSNTCSEFATCADTLGSYNCTCNTGYAGDLLYIKLNVMTQ